MAEYSSSDCKGFTSYESWIVGSLTRIVSKPRQIWSLQQKVWRIDDKIIIRILLKVRLFEIWIGWEIQENWPVDWFENDPNWGKIK